MPTIVLNKGPSFEARSGESILDAARRSQKMLPYSCRTGRCSSCKCRVLNGVSEPLHPELGLTQQEMDEGWILSCVRTATSDMNLEADQLMEVELPPVKTLPCRIQSLERPAPDVLVVKLRLPPSSSFSYLAGQYVEIIVPGCGRRSYSLAGAERGEKLIELHVRFVPGGLMSDYWFSRAKENDLLHLCGPHGTFVLRDLGGRDLKFLATGTGIAPVKAMLESMEIGRLRDPPRSIAVYWGARNPVDLYLSLAAFGCIDRYVPALSRAPVAWRGFRGHVQVALLADAPVLADSIVYACGSDAMIRSARDTLVGLGLPKNRFLSDAFVCSAET